MRGMLRDPRAQGMWEGGSASSLSIPRMSRSLPAPGQGRADSGMPNQALEEQQAEKIGELRLCLRAQLPSVGPSASSPSRTEHRFRAGSQQSLCPDQRGAKERENPRKKRGEKFGGSSSTAPHCPFSSCSRCPQEMQGGDWKVPGPSRCWGFKKPHSNFIYTTLVCSM